MLRVAWSPIYRYELPEGHRFPMEKYDLLPEQLIREGTLASENLFEPQAAEEATLLKTHTRAYWESLRDQTLDPKAIRKIGFPMRPKLVERGRHIAQGTLDCAFHAMNDGISLNTAGGTHHSYADHGEGFCVFNDIAIASNELLDLGMVGKILVVDLDVHQGNGTAHIFADQPKVFTFSMHGARNYPLRKEQSSLDVGLPDGMTDEAYLNLLDRHLETLLDQVMPDIVFYQAGVDVLATDKLGRLALSRQGCRRRDEMVMNSCRRHQVPLVVTMGGGYSLRLADVIEAHANTFRAAQQIFF